MASELYVLQPTNQPANKTSTGIGSWDSGSMIRFTVPPANAYLEGGFLSGVLMFVDASGREIQMLPEFKTETVIPTSPLGAIVDLCAKTGMFGAFSTVLATRAYTAITLEELPQADQVMNFVAQRHGVDWIGKSSGNWAYPAFSDVSFSTGHAVGKYGQGRKLALQVPLGCLNNRPIPLSQVNGINGLGLDITIGRLSDCGNTTWDADSAYRTLDNGTEPAMTMRDPVSGVALDYNLGNITLRIVNPKLWVSLKPMMGAPPPTTPFVYSTTNIQRTPMNFNNNQYFTSPINQAFVKSIFYEISDRNMQTRPSLWRYGTNAFAYENLVLLFNGEPQVYKIPSAAFPVDAQITPYVPNAFLMSAFYNMDVSTDFNKAMWGSQAAFYYDPEGNGKFFSGIQVQFQMTLKVIAKPLYPFNNFENHWSQVQRPFAITGDRFLTYRTNNINIDIRSGDAFLQPGVIAGKGDANITMDCSNPNSKFMKPIEASNTKDLLTITERIATLIINQESQTIIQEAPPVPSVPRLLELNQAAPVSSVMRVVPYRIDPEVIAGDRGAGPYNTTLRMLTPASGKPGRIILRFMPQPTYTRGKENLGVTGTVVGASVAVNAAGVKMPVCMRGSGTMSLGLSLVYGYTGTNAGTRVVSSYMIPGTTQPYAAADSLTPITTYITDFDTYCTDPRASLVNTLGYPSVVGTAAWFDSILIDLPQGRQLQIHDVAQDRFLKKQGDPSQRHQWSGRWSEHVSNAWAVDSSYNGKYSDVLLNRQRNTAFSEWDSIYPCYHDTQQDLSDFYLNYPPMTTLDLTHVHEVFEQLKNAMYVSAGATKMFLSMVFNTLGQNFANCPAGAGFNHLCDPDFKKSIYSSSVWGTKPMVGLPRRNATTFSIRTDGIYRPYFTANCIFFDEVTQNKLEVDFRARGCSIRTTQFYKEHRFYNANPDDGLSTPRKPVQAYDQIKANPPYDMGGQNPSVLYLQHTAAQLVKGKLSLFTAPETYERPRQRTRVNKADTTQLIYVYSESWQLPFYVGMRDGPFYSVPGAAVDEQSNFDQNGYELLPLYQILGDGQLMFKFPAGSPEFKQAYDALINGFPCQRPEWEVFPGTHRRCNIYESRMYRYFATPEMGITADAKIFVPDCHGMVFSTSVTSDTQKLRTWYQKSGAFSCFPPSRYLMPILVPDDFRSFGLLTIDGASITVGVSQEQATVPYTNWFHMGFHPINWNTLDTYQIEYDWFGSNKYVKQLMVPEIACRTLAQLQHVIVQFNDLNSSVLYDFPAGLKM